MREKCTILIQGPLNPVSIQNISQYLKFGNVMISHWDHDDLDILKDVDKKNGAIKIVSQRMPPRDEWGPMWEVQHKSQSTFPWSVYSTFLGLKNIDTEYTIKTRSDESFENLQSMIDLHLQTEKLVFGSVFARSWSSLHYQIGDHVFMERTDMLRKTYQNILENEDIRCSSLWCAEQILAINYLRARFENKSKCYDAPLEKTPPAAVDAVQEENARKAFECIDVNLLGSFTIQHQHASKRWDNDFNNSSYTPNGVNTTQEMFRK